MMADMVAEVAVEVEAGVVVEGLMVVVSATGPKGRACTIAAETAGEAKNTREFLSNIQKTV